MLLCNIVSHWLGTYTKWSLCNGMMAWINSDLLSIGLLGTHSSEIGMKIWQSAFNKLPINVLFAKCCQFCFSLNVMKSAHNVTYSIHHVSHVSKVSDNFNTLRPGQNGRHFADEILKCIFLNENVWIPIKISLKFVPKGPINNIPALVQIMAWRRPGDKPLSEPVMVRLPTHICVTQPQWVKWCIYEHKFFFLVDQFQILL